MEAKLRKMTVEEIHIELFNTLLHIDDICRKHHIEYFLGFGTLLGCVRDGGFLPWDDDIDIVMKRDEFERFNKILPEAIDNEKFFYINGSSRKNYPCWSYITRIGPKGTFRKMDYFLDDECFQSGIFIDVFVLDYAPENIFLYRIQTLMLAIIDSIISFKTCKTEYVKEWIVIGKYIYQLLGDRISVYWLNKLREKVQTGFKRTSKKICVPFGDIGRYPLIKVYWDLKDFDDIEYMEFIVYGKDAQIYKHRFPIPIGYKHILEITYKAWETHPLLKQSKGLSYWIE